MTLWNSRLTQKRRHELSRRPLLGVLGGMGPLATAHFYTTLIKHTPVTHDQDHLPVVIAADPRMPDRTTAILERREDEVLEALLSGVRRLEAAGADFLVMPCNTAHHWLARLQEMTECPFLSIVDSSVNLASKQNPAAQSVVVIATEGTLNAAIYDRCLGDAGLIAKPLDPRHTHLVNEVIKDVKFGSIGSARRKVRKVIESALQTADVALLACTELPIAAEPMIEADARIIDTTLALVRACVSWADERSSRRLDPRLRPSARS